MVTRLRRLVASVLLAAGAMGAAESFVGVASAVASRSDRERTRPAASAIDSIPEPDEEYARSFEVVDACAASGEPSDDLYDRVRYVDRNALSLYPDDDAKRDLWDRAHGSWRLRLATGGGKFTTFKPVPIFAYAMIDEHRFGNGVGLNEEGVVLSLLGPHHFDARRRQMGIGIDDVFLFANRVTEFVPGFIAEGMGLGKTPEDYRAVKSRMPTFTIIGASDKSLVARGGSGGIAIWTKLEKDIRPAAYGNDGSGRR